MRRLSSFGVICCAGVVSACMSLARPLYVEVELTGFPENPVAVRMGVITALVEERGKGNAELNFELAGQKFKGVMQTIDDAVTTSGRVASTSQAQGVGVSGRVVSTAATATQSKGSSTSTTRSAASRGSANALSDKGLTMTCDYTVNNAQLTGAGTCEISNGAKYKFYAKPLRVVLSDGTSRPM